MNNTIIGTAGHVDHGKTCLIRALTGIDTDRLQEEKKRGITIELGFAYLDLPNGERAGIVDVPGHEKFIKNMLAGAGGIDLVLFIVAADEGVMPQTVEHLGILQMLGIERGIIVVTKKDMVDGDWLELICEDIREKVRDTFLESAPMCTVSAYTGDGIDELRQMIFDAVAGGSVKTCDGPFRIPVDRVFSVEGFGTVITGTTIEGTLREGQEVMLYPSRRTARARNIQVHSTGAEQAFAGQRTAVNLAGMKKDEVSRGDVVATPDSMLVSQMLDVKLSILTESERVVKNNSRLHFYHGAREAVCKVVLFGQDELRAGESCYAQLRFEEEIAVKYGDRFVVRFFSPLETVGGGIVLDPCPEKHKRSDESVPVGMTIKEQGPAAERVLQSILERSKYFGEIEFTRLQVGLPQEKMDAILKELLEAEQIVKITDRIYLHIDYSKAIRRKLVSLLDAYHKEYPLKAGIKREELRTRLLPREELAHVDRLIDYYIEKRAIKEYQGMLSLASFQVEVGEQLLKLQKELEAWYLKEPFAPPATDDVMAAYAKEKNLTHLLNAMLADGTLVRLDAQIYIHRDAYEQAVELVRQMIARDGQVVLGEYRDALGTSRKFAVALLEQFDRVKLTKKVGDARILTKQG